MSKSNMAAAAAAAAAAATTTTTTMHTGLCIIICLSLSIKFARTDTSYPSIIAPDPKDEAVLSFDFNELTKIAHISVQEEVDHPLCIAVLNYKEDSPPMIGTLNDGKSNYVLGANLRQSNQVWSLWIDNKQDYEIKMMQGYRFPVYLGSYAFGIVLDIRNIDDNTPVIQALEKDCKIEENRPGKSNCSYTVSDADGWMDQVEIKLGPDTAVENLRFVSLAGANLEYERNGYLNVTKSLDFEAISTYMVEIRAIDGAGNVGTLDVIVKVTDVADMPPVWTRITTAESILEKTSNRIQVSALDGDVQINEEINYKIELMDARDENYFVVNDTTGVITINEIDRDERNQEIFHFVIIAYEKFDSKSRIDATITVIVEDVNDHSPLITPDALEIDIAEETYVALEFQQPIKINDPDLGENAQFSVRLMDESKHNWSSAFLVIPTNGYQSGTFTISVADASLLDYENDDWRVIDIQLQAIEVKNSSHIGTKNIRIQLKDLNDELPIFDRNTPSTVRIPEDVGKLFSIATVHATDRDANDTVTHSLVAQHALTINEETGTIVTNQDGAFDYESMPVVVVQIVATDDAKHKTYTTLTINVTDVNDVPPKLYLSKESPQVEEEMPLGTRLNVSILAFDEDTDGELMFSIDWDNTRAQKRSVDVHESHYRNNLEIRTKWPNGGEDKREATGDLVIAGRIDYEKFDVIFLTVSVTDSQTKHNDNVTFASLTLYIQDINDNEPKFFNVKEKMDVSENQISGALIGTVTAVDDDGPLYSKVSYSIEPIENTEYELVVIENLTGVVKVGLDKGIDADKYEYMYYNVTASDGERNSTLTLKIYVIDQNDEVPYLLDEQFESVIFIPEKSPNGTYITTIRAADDDRTSPFNNVSYLMNEDYAAPTNYFSIGRSDGVIRVNLAKELILDRDRAQSKFTLNLKLRDNYLVDFVTSNSNAIDLTVTVVLLDINDQKPLLPDMGEPAVSVTENTKKGERILVVVAEDLDDPNTNNTKVFYLIKSITSANNEEYANLDGSYESLFYVETRDDKTANIFTNYDLKGYYGRWIIELYSQDFGSNPGAQNDTRNYVVQVKDFNYNKPVIQFPNEEKIPLRKEQTLHAQLRTYDDQLLSDFKADDEDYGASGVVTFSLTSTNGDHTNFEMVSMSVNVAQLRLAKAIDVEAKNTYTLTALATDNGSPPFIETREFTVIFVTKSGPKFVTNELNLWMKENKTGVGAWSLIPEAYDMLGETNGNAINIYYFLMPDEADTRYFALDKSTRNLTVQYELDREKDDKLKFHVVATPDKDEPPRNPLDDAVLEVTVNVLDENDEAPIFQSKFYSAGVTMEDALDKVLLTVKAVDADLNDTLTYSNIQSSIATSHSSLSTISEPFSMNPDTGDLALNFTVTSNMEGFFTFDVIARDKVKHNDTCTVRVYVVPQSSRVVYTFNNLASQIKQESFFVADSFTKVYGYLCNIDNIKSTVARAQVLDNSTTVTTHFISSTDDLPIQADVIVLASSDLQTISNLKATLLTRFLYLVDVPTSSSSVADDPEDIVLWILATLTIVFFLSSTTLLTGFVIRTKRLNQRLERLAITQYQSQESGLDRVGVVPTTNQFASAGSNPIWKTPQKSMDDNISKGSGDSDLIGIEDDPDFGYVNDAMMNSGAWKDIGEGSVNPAFANSDIGRGSLFTAIVSAQRKE